MVKYSKDDLARYGKACNNLLYVCGNCKPEDKILIVSDYFSFEIAKLLWDAADEFPNKVLMLMEDQKMHGEEPPEQVAKAMLECDVMYRVTKFSLSHSMARKNALKAGKRDVNMADFRLHMFEKGGLLADFDKMEAESRIVAAKLPGTTMHITAPGGTDITFDITGNPGRIGYGRSIPGHSVIAPDIEANIGGREGTGFGVIKVDGSIPHPDLGLITDDVWLKVEGSEIVDIYGGPQADKLAEILKEFNDPQVYRLGEIGIGLNPMSELCGLMLEDEGAYGTVHFGIGNNTTWGGTASCALHLDAVIKDPTLIVDGRVIINAGDVILD